MNLCTLHNKRSISHDKNIITQKWQPADTGESILWRQAIFLYIERRNCSPLQEKQFGFMHLYNIVVMHL